MADEQVQTPPPVSGDQALGNDPTARNPDGSLKDNQAAPTATPSSDEKKPEAKPEGDKKPEAAKDDKPAAGAPEKYEAFKAPEKYELDPKLIDAATPIFKELNLDQAGAQKLIDFYSAQAIKASQAPIEAYETMRSDWRKDVIADRDIGNGTDGLKPEVASKIAQAIDSLPADQAKGLREALTFTGAGDNPAFVKAFHTLAQRLGEGNFVQGGGPSKAGQQAPGSKGTAAQALYPNLPSSAR